MNHTQRIASILAVAVMALAAVVTPAQAQVDTGSADFTRFVALGDSLTQGFSNGGVYQGVQVNSIPAIIARQAGVTDFEQPLISAPGIPGLLRLVNLVPPTLVPRPGNGAPINLSLPRPYNNLAVSGFDTGDVVNTRTGNPLIDVTLRGLGTALEQAVALQPTFTFVWLGNNDVLGAATSGIVIDGVTLTRVADFNAARMTIISALRATGSQIILTTLPDVTTIPFVNTLATVVVDPATQRPVLDPNGNPIPLIGPDGPLTPNDRVLLSATTELALGKGLPPALGGTGPLSDSSVLSAAELAVISERVDRLNSFIRGSAADNSQVTLFDFNAFFRDVAANGYNIGGIELTTDFLTGGIFSYDGVHATPLGYAVVANEIIKLINDRFQAEIPLADLNPFLFGPDGAAGAILPPGTPVQSTLYTEQAVANLHEALRVPSEEELQGNRPLIPLIPTPTRMAPNSPVFRPIAP